MLNYEYEGVGVVAKLKYTFKNDTLFKMLFVQCPDLLKKLVAELLGIAMDGKMPPESLGDKFCRLDISMTVNGQRVNLEVQQLSEISDKPCISTFIFSWNSLLRT
jgi:hypothetical protein